MDSSFTASEQGFFLGLYRCAVLEQEKLPDSFRKALQQVEQLIAEHGEAIFYELPKRWRELVT
ncbi:hypothetical protein [Aeoliella mucimassa]|uniref:Uncharacterized protein n=1 Tax=Aeoliella mucimassa TaxID=2527972 RepID=A0A518AMA2_9BACT|nr:hypothetical protein [Aeoliella mucimassa]QDU55851.1 hypothetical protein Pan181_20480 [Aeoliella mucimassa]